MNNNARIFVALLYSHLDSYSSGEAAEERNRRAAQRAEREHGGAKAAEERNRRAAQRAERKQRRNGIAEPRSGRSDGEGERAEEWNRGGTK